MYIYLSWQTDCKNWEVDIFTLPCVTFVRAKKMLSVKFHTWLWKMRGKRLNYTIPFVIRYLSGSFTKLFVEILTYYTLLPNWLLRCGRGKSFLKFFSYDFSYILPNLHLLYEVIFLWNLIIFGYHTFRIIHCLCVARGSPSRRSFWVPFFKILLQINVLRILQFCQTPFCYENWESNVVYANV